MPIYITFVRLFYFIYLNCFLSHFTSLKQFNLCKKTYYIIMLLYNTCNTIQYPRPYHSKNLIFRYYSRNNQTQCKVCKTETARLFVLTINYKLGRYHNIRMI